MPSREVSAKKVLNVARKFFILLDGENFEYVFKLSPVQIAQHLFTPKISLFRTPIETAGQQVRKIRDFLIILYWCRNYPSFRALGAYFGMKNDRARKIVKSQIEILANKVSEYVNVQNVDSPDDFFLKNCVGITLIAKNLLLICTGAVDTTELPIWAWVGDAYSGKKKCFTMKYQVVVCLITKKPIQISGPFFGKVSDSEIWRLSGMANFLEEDDLWVIGDKGYVGCRRVKHCLKRKKGQKRLPRSKKEYNRSISTKRVFVENHFAELKVFKAVSHCFRGHLEDHVDIFNCCEVLLCISKT